MIEKNNNNKLFKIWNKINEVDFDYKKLINVDIDYIKKCYLENNYEYYIYQNDKFNESNSKLFVLPLNVPSDYFAYIKLTPILRIVEDVERDRYTISPDCFQLYHYLNYRIFENNEYYYLVGNIYIYFKNISDNTTPLCELDLKFNIINPQETNVTL